MFKELRAFSTKIKIIPNETIIDLSIKRTIRFIVKDRLKKSELKKEKIWKVLADVKLSGYATFKTT